MLEGRQIVRRGNEQDLLHARQHQHGERVVDHRLVIDRDELLAHRVGHREKAAAGAAGEDDAFPQREIFGRLDETAFFFR
jgi:hypothetical protein